MQAIPHTPTHPYTHTPVIVWLARLAYTSAFTAVILGSVALTGVAAFSLRHRGAIVPGVSAWGVELSGKTPAEAAVSLSAAFAYPSSAAFTFRDGERTWTATPAQLGLTFDLPASISAAYDVGRSGNPVRDGIAQFEAWYFGAQVSPVVIYDEQQTLVYLNHVAQQVFRPTVEASLVAEGATVTTTPGQIGRQLDVPAVAAAVRPHLQALGTADLPLAFVETPPRVLDASAQAAAAQAILRDPLTLTVADPEEGDPGTWTIDQATLASMLQVRRVDDSANAAHYEVGLDPAGLRAFLEPMAPELEQKARNARFVFNDETGQLDLMEPSRQARQLDIGATIALINQELLRGVHSVPIVFKTVAPEVGDDATGAQLGITQLVSEQSTYFAGSGAERVNNIRLAGARFHGLLVPPNAVFSFAEHLGDVSLDTGFAEALIIFGGRTIRGVGGGVCQVSTTIFRAAYFGGYPIAERYSHAYRVSYYERGDTWRGPGLDATVYAPLVDFKFQNDTPYWLLMEVYTNEAAGRITWKFYSTSDGRQVSVSLPDVQNVVPAPEPLYEEDPALKPGEIKQVDFAADGADVTVYRTITRNGAQVNTGERPMRTHYQPWRAVYHYGPGTEGIPTPTPEPTPTPTP